MARHRLRLWASPTAWFAVALATLAWIAPPAADHPDALRDWLAALDCTQRGQCWMAGSATSVAGLHNGTLWPNTLALLQWLGLGLPAAWWLAVAAPAVAVALVFATARRAGNAAGAHVGAAVALGLAAAGIADQALWAPALSPLWAAVLAATAMTGEKRGFGWFAACGLWAGVLADAHPIGALAGVGWLAAACTGLPTPRALAGAATGAIAAIMAAVALAPAAQVANGGWLLAEHSGPTAGAAAVGAVAVVAVSRCGGSAWMRPAVAAAVPVGVIAAAAALGKPVYGRYGAAAGPALGLLAAALVACSPWRAVAAAAISVASVALHFGRGGVSLGHDWPAVETAAQLAAKSGLGYPQLIGRTQGFGCRRLAAGMGTVLAGHPQAAPAGLGKAALQLVDLPADVTNPGGSFSRADAVATAGTAAWVRATDAWLDANRGTVCLQVAGAAEQCQALEPGVGWPRNAGDRDAPLHLRAYPRLTKLSPPRGQAAETRVDVAVTMPIGGARWLRITDAPRQLCPWQAVSAGLLQVRPLGADTYELRADAAGEYAVRFVRRWGPDCDDVSRWTDGPPCFLEAEPQAAWLALAVAP